MDERTTGKYNVSNVHAYCSQKYKNNTDENTWCNTCQVSDDVQFRQGTLLQEQQEHSLRVSLNVQFQWHELMTFITGTMNRSTSSVTVRWWRLYDSCWWLHNSWTCACCDHSTSYNITWPAYFHWYFTRDGWWLVNSSSILSFYMSTLLLNQRPTVVTPGQHIGTVFSTCLLTRIFTDAATLWHTDTDSTALTIHNVTMLHWLRWLICRTPAQLLYVR